MKSSGWEGVEIRQESVSGDRAQRPTDDGNTTMTVTCRWYVVLLEPLVEEQPNLVSPLLEVRLSARISLGHRRDLSRSQKAGGRIISTVDSDDADVVGCSQGNDSVEND